MTSPFKFLDSYTREDQAIFFGRESETEEIYTRIFQEKTLLVYGASGTGKTSLIACGLANKFQEADWLPVFIRRGNDITGSTLHQVEKLALTPVRPGQKSLAKVLKSVYLDHFKPVYLIFDQFEELFIFGQPEEWQQFARSVREVLDQALQVRFIFVVRGEYLEQLTEIEKILPELFSNRIRIERMTRTKALACISGPCGAAGIQVEDHFAEDMLQKLSPGKTEIELTYLQVFLDRIYQQAVLEKTGDQLQFTRRLLEKVGNIGDVLARFLDDQLNQMPNPEQALTLLKAFVSTDATKRQVSLNEAQQFMRTLGRPMEMPQLDELVQLLIARRLLRDQDDAGKFELRHDSLAGKIFEKISSYERNLIEVNEFIAYALAENEKRGFLLNESDLAYIAPYEDRLQLTSEGKAFVEKSKAAVRRKNRSRKQVLAVMTVISVLLVTSALGLYFSLEQKAEATRNAELAADQSRQAIEARDTAVLMMTEARGQRELAEDRRQESERQSQIAQEQTRLAEQARRMADQQRRIAISERGKADAARVAAEQSATEANVQRNLAEQERSKAEQASLINLTRTVASKALHTDDPELRALLALQSWQLNLQAGGYPEQAEIYSGLFEARSGLLGAGFHAAPAHRGAVKAVVYRSPYFYSAGSDGRILRSRISGEKLQPKKFIETTEMINTLTFSADSTRLLAGTEEGNIFIYELATGKQLSTVMNQDLLHLGTLENRYRVSKWIVNTSNAGIVSNGTVVIRRQANGQFGGWNGNYLALNTADLKSVLLPEKIVKMQIIAEFGNRIVKASVISRNGYFGLAGLSDGSVMHFPVRPNASTQLLVSGKGNSVTALAVHPSQTVFATGYENGTVEVGLIARLPGKYTLNKNLFFRWFNADSSASAASYPRESIFKNLVSRLTHQMEPYTFNLSVQKSAITSLQFSSNGNYLVATSMDGQVIVWDVEAQTQTPLVLPNHGNWVWTGSITAGQDQMLVSGDHQGVLRLFPLRSEALARGLCEKLSRNLTETEWAYYFGENSTGFMAENMAYRKTCPLLD